MGTCNTQTNVLSMGGYSGGWEQVIRTPSGKAQVTIHEYVSLEILLQTPFQEQLDKLLLEKKVVWLSLKYVDD